MPEQKDYTKYTWNADKEFRTGSGRFRTNSLVFEYKYKDEDVDGFKPVFTIGEQDKDRYISLRQIYLAHSDPTEYFFAKAVFGSWDFWKELRECQALKGFVDRWREELEVKLRAQAFVSIIETAKDETNKNSYDANKMIVREGWKLPESSLSGKGRGRPSKEEIKQELSKQAALEKRVIEDAKRAGIVVELNKKVV